jgi:diguanylate cyclase (GGDEF)-like protein/PAS domain S-box-containing protein
MTLTPEQVIAHTEQLIAAGHWYLDLADGSLVWSEQVYRIHGLDPSEPQPDTATALGFYVENDREVVREQLERLRQTGEPLDFTARIRRRDGVERYVRASGKHIPPSSGRAGYLFGVFRDITEEWLERRHQRRVALALEETAEAIIMSDPQGRLIWCNSAVTRLSGHSLDDLYGQKPGHILQGPDTDPDTVAHMRECLAAERGFVVEILNYHCNGDAYWIRLSCHPDRDERGDLVGFTAIQSDITEEKTIRVNLEQEVERRIELEAQLRHLASHDALSGLPNRRHFFDQAERELARCRRYERPLSLVLFDLDEFKAVNDDLGHAAGDAVIRAVGELCGRTLREQDFAARIGGEEFIILLPETGVEGAQTLAERLRGELSQTPIPVGTDSVYVTASFGVTQARPDRDTVERFLARADRALYEAKNRGRNRTEQR